MRLHFREYGWGAPLVILHGLLGSLENWHPVSRRLADRFRVLAVDLRNHGASPHAAEMSHEVMAGDLARLLRDQGIAQASLLGHSLGGKVAMEFALRFPQSVRKLIVVDVAPRACATGQDRVIAELLALDLKAFHRRKDMESALAAQIPDLEERRFLLKNIFRDVAGAFHWKPDLEEIRRSLPVLNAAIATGRVCASPALFVRGGRSDFIREVDREPIRRLFPEAEFHTVPEAGHWVQVDAPEALVARINLFLAAGE
jgi:esterase